MLSVLDPAGALKWRGAAGCAEKDPCAVARPLLLRPGPDGGGLFLSSRAIPSGRRVLALSGGRVVGVGTGWGGRLVHLRGLGHPETLLAVESPDGLSAVLKGEGGWGRLLFRPGDDPVAGWVTAGDALGTPRGWPVGEEEANRTLRVDRLARGVGLAWTE